ncbi:hypothetical protein LCGC14_0819910 [marine sediment metagenome]|uniref:Uncharacterized protein n=1 Tax=marine sediment metagenome TaxID=412755 RepID=A0A0F9Q4K7_9ZZZZ
MRSHKPVPLEERCENTVFDPRILGGHRCYRRYKLKENGKQWCKAHAPSTRNAKRQAQHEEWEQRQVVFLQQRAEKAERERRSDCYTDLLEACRDGLGLLVTHLGDRLDGTYQAVRAIMEEAIAKADPPGPTIRGKE